MSRYLCLQSVVEMQVMEIWRTQPRTGQIWWVFVVRGLLAAALGIFAIIWSTLILEILVLLVGACLIADGVMSVVIAIRRAAAAGRMLQPLISVLVGLLLVLWPGESARTLIVVMGAAALFIGISYVVTARRFGVDAMDRQLMTGAGIVAAVLGVILIVWPGAAAVVFSWMIAAAALLMAAVLIVLGVRFRQLRVEVNPPRSPAG